MFKRLQEIKEVNQLLQEDSTSHIYIKQLKNQYISGGGDISNSFTHPSSQKKFPEHLLHTRPKTSAGDTDIINKTNGCFSEIPSLV